MSAQDKNSFHYRMSKKVAELTQVVHMLFTRNHEKEIEMAAMKDSYEHEIELVLQDAKSRIAKLESDIEELNKQILLNAEQSHSHRDTGLAENDAKWRQKLSDKETCLREEQIQTQNLRGTLINTQEEIETLKQKFSQELETKIDEIKRKDEEINQIRNKLTDAENRQNSIPVNGQSVTDELQRNNEKLASEIIQLQSLLTKSSKNNEILMYKNKQFESDLKDLKAQYKRLYQTNIKQTKDTKSTDVNEELERLKLEVQRYRLELSNRDNNFTKMFCEKQPGLVTQKSHGSQHKGLMSVVVPPGYTRNISPFGILRTASSTPLVPTLSKERPSMLGYWDGQRKPSRSISNSIACESTDSDIDTFTYQQILDDHAQLSIKKNKSLLNVKDSGNTKQETTNEQTSSNYQRLPSLPSRESNKMTTPLSKPKILTKSSLFVK